MQQNPFLYHTLIIANLVFVVHLNVTAQDLLSAKSSTYQKIEKVYKKLQQATGDFRRDLPKLVVIERVARVASYRSSDNTLIIEKKALAVVINRLCKFRFEKYQSWLMTTVFFFRFN